MDNYKKSIEKFIGEDNNQDQLNGDNIVEIKNKSGLIEVEKINKKIIVEDGRQLLI